MDSQRSANGITEFVWPELILARKDLNPLGETGASLYRHLQAKGEIVDVDAAVSREQRLVRKYPEVSATARFLQCCINPSVKLADRRERKVWELRWREVQIDGLVCRKNIVVGTLEEFPTESAAQYAVDAVRLPIKRQTLQRLLKSVSVETLVKHYQEHELPDIFSKRKPATGNSDEHRKSYSSSTPTTFT